MKKILADISETLSNNSVKQRLLIQRYEENELTLSRLTGLGINELIELFAKGYTLQPPARYDFGHGDHNSNVIFVSHDMYERIKNNPDKIIIEAQCEPMLVLKVVAYSK